MFVNVNTTLIKINPWSVLRQSVHIITSTVGVTEHEVHSVIAPTPTSLDSDMLNLLIYTDSSTSLT